MSSLPFDQKIKVQSKQKQHCILIVEDQPVAALVAKTVFSELGCNVNIAINGLNALTLIKQNPYDLILMDIGLPDIDGYEITKQIRLYEDDTLHKVPIVALTAHTDVENKERCLNVGMNAVLTKPLLKKQALQVLKVFIPDYTKTLNASHPEEDQEFPDSSEKFIDFKIAKEILGQEKIIKKVLTMLVHNLTEEKIKLNEAYAKKDWREIQEIAHKISGGASYCGALRLKAVSTSLKNHIAKNNPEAVEHDYHKMQREIDDLIQYITNNNLSEENK